MAAIRCGAGSARPAPTLESARLLWIAVSGCQSKRALFSLSRARLPVSWHVGDCLDATAQEPGGGRGHVSFPAPRCGHGLLARDGCRVVLSNFGLHDLVARVSALGCRRLLALAAVGGRHCDPTTSRLGRNRLGSGDRRGARERPLGAGSASAVGSRCLCPLDAPACLVYTRANTSSDTGGCAGIDGWVRAGRVALRAPELADRRVHEIELSRGQAARWRHRNTSAWTGGATAVRTADHLWRGTSRQRLHRPGFQPRKRRRRLRRPADGTFSSDRSAGTAVDTAGR